MTIPLLIVGLHVLPMLIMGVGWLLCPTDNRR